MYRSSQSPQNVNSQPNEFFGRTIAELYNARIDANGQSDYRDEQIQEAAKMRCADTAIMISDPGVSVDLEKYKLTGCKVEFLSSEDVTFLIIAHFGNLIKEVYIVVKEPNLFLQFLAAVLKLSSNLLETLHFSFKMQKIQNHETNAEIKIDLIEVIAVIIMDTTKHRTIHIRNIGLYIDGVVNKWPKKWRKLSPALTSFTVHATMTRKYFTRLCRYRYISLKHVDMNVFIYGRTPDNEKEITDLMEHSFEALLIGAKNLVSFSSNRMIKGFLPALLSASRIQALGIDSTGIEFNSLEEAKLEFNTIKTLSIKADSSKILQYISRVDNLRKLTLSGFPLDQIASKFIKKSKNTLTDLSLFYIKPGRKNFFVNIEKLVRCFKMLERLDLAWDKSFKWNREYFHKYIDDLFRLNKSMTINFLVRKRSIGQQTLMQAASKYYDLIPVLDDLVGIDVWEMKLRDQSNLPRRPNKILAGTIKMYRGFFKNVVEYTNNLIAKQNSQPQ